MSTPILVRHPAIVTHTPPRARTSRSEAVEATSTVRLPEASRSDFASLGTLQRYEAEGLPWDKVSDPLDPRRLSRSSLTQRLFARDGAVWTILRTGPEGRFPASRTWRPVKSAELVAFLSGAPVDDSVEAGIRRACLRSPIAVPGAGRAQVSAGTGTFREGRILRDGRDTAAAELQAWLDANLALVGNEVRVRSPGTFLIPAAMNLAYNVLETMPHGAGLDSPKAYLPGDGRLGDALIPLGSGQIQAGLTLGAIGALVDRDDLLRYFANAVPDFVMSRGRAARAKEMARFPGDVEAFDEGLHSFRTRAALAMTGGLGPHDAEPLAKALLSLASPGPASRHVPHLGVLKDLSRHAKEYLLPLSAAAPHLDEDAAEFEAMTP